MCVPSFSFSFSSSIFPALQFQVVVKVWGLLNKHVGSCFQSISFLFSRCLVPSVFKMMCSLLTEKSESEVSQSCPTLGSVSLLCPWDSPGKNTEVDCHFLLQEIFPTQGSNWGFLHCRQTLYCLSHQKCRSLLRGI